MRAELDISFLSQDLFTGTQRASSALSRIQGDGYLLIKVRNGQVVTSSFMFGLLKSNRFQGIHVSDNEHKELHQSEVKSATERYACWVNYGY